MIAENLSLEMNSMHSETTHGKRFKSSLFWLLIVLVAMTGCLPRGENSWQHYTGGGHYPARTPSMSADGSTIVFSSPRSGEGDIYRVNSDGSGTIRLTSDPSFESDPVFSLDGSTIAFAREKNGCRHIWLMDRDGKNQRQLTFGRVLDDVQSFSPDGSELLLIRSPLPTGMGRLIGYFAVNLGTKTVRKLEGLLEYSADGSRVAYSVLSQANDRYEIWVMDVNGDDKHFVTAGYSPRLSPDGGMILYTTEMKHPGSLWKMIAIDGKGNRELGQMADPVLTRDGKQIVYVSPTWQRELWKNGPRRHKRDSTGARPSGISIFSGHVVPASF